MLSHLKPLIKFRCSNLLRMLLIPLCWTLVNANCLTLSASELPSNDFTELSLEELINIEVISVSKKAERLSDTDAAVFVITQEDLKRSGVTSIPEALRMVPGLQVARIDTNKWAISARGFNGRFSAKLLVLIDGRTVYSPHFSGVFWGMQDTLMEDIDRIEIIRGPGATLWGANAVNGVINIITKRTVDTQGGLVTAGGGTEERGFGLVRFGVKAGENFHYRLFAKYFNRDNSKYLAGGDAKDKSDAFRTGFRMDLSHEINFQGEFFRGDGGSEISIPIPLPPYTRMNDDDIDTGGGYLLGRWSRNFSNGSSIEAQLYYDRSEYDMFLADTTADTIDFDLNHRFQMGKRQEVIWGIGYRFIKDELKMNTALGTIDQNEDERHMVSGFVQDEIHLMDELRLTIGSKFEDNRYTGFEFQPSARILWTPEKPFSLWASVSRAVRTPSRGEATIDIDLDPIPAGAFLPLFPGAGVVRNVGSMDFESEDLLAFEMGFRAQLKETISLDLAMFYNIYSDIRGSLPAPDSAFVDFSNGIPFMVVPVVMANPADMDTYGFELALDWFISANWRIKSAYAFLKFKTDDIFGQSESKTSPRNQVSIMSSWDLSDTIDLNIWARYVDSIGLAQIDSYLTADLRLAWQVIDGLEISLVGQNLLDPEHPEYFPQFLKSLPSEVERSVYGKLEWRF